MVRTPTKVTNTVLLLLLPLLTITGCAKPLGVEEGLAPEDEPYLCDRWDPGFELARPCQDISDQTLKQLGLERWVNEYAVPDGDGLDSCDFRTEDFGMIDLSGAAYKLATLERQGVRLDYEVGADKQPAFVFKDDELDSYCRIAAETPRGTVEVGFSSSATEELPELEECKQAEKYFDFLIGERLNEYRTN